MKKVLALVLALMMALAMLTVATADEAKKPYIGILGSRDHPRLGWRRRLLCAAGRRFPGHQV